LIDIEADETEVRPHSDVLHSEENPGHLVEKLLQAFIRNHGMASSGFSSGSLIANIGTAVNSFRKAVSNIMDRASRVTTWTGLASFAAS